MGMMGNGFGGFGLMGGVGSLFNISVLVGIIWLVGWGIKQFNQSRNPASPLSPNHSDLAHSAHEILDIRYARGELTREEYQTMLEDLS